MKNIFRLQLHWVVRWFLIYARKKDVKYATKPSK